MSHPKFVDVAELLFVCLSAGGGFFMLTSFALFKGLRTTFGKISMWFAICGIGSSLYPLFGSPRAGSPLCLLQAAVGSYFVVCSLTTATLLMQAIFKLFYPHPSGPNRTALAITWWKIGYTWGTPLVLVILPLFTGSYGKDAEDDEYCWIDTNRGHNSTGVAMAFATFYVPIWLCIAYCVVLCVLIGKKALEMQEQGSATSSKIMKIAHKCKWYPIIAVVCWLLRTAIRLGEIFDFYDYNMSVTGSLISYLQGFFDCLAYCRTTRVLKSWKQFLLNEKTAQDVYDSSNCIRDDTLLQELAEQNAVLSSSRMPSTESNSSSQFDDEYEEDEFLIPTMNVNTSVDRFNSRSSDFAVSNTFFPSNKNNRPVPPNAF